MSVFIGPFQAMQLDEHVTAWTRPASAVGLIDLRSLSTQATTPTGNVVGDNVGVFIGGPDFNPGSDYQQLPIIGWTGTDTRRFRQRFNLPSTVAPVGIMDAIEQVMCLYGDPSGENGPRPLIPGVRNRTMRLGPLRQQQRFVDPKSYSLLRQTLQIDYRQLRQQYREHGTHLKWLGFQTQKYRLSGNDYRLIQGDEPDEFPRRPETVITESFNTADSTTLGPDLSWTEVSGSDDFDIFSSSIRAINNRSATRRLARADSDLSGDDHYAQVDVVAFGGISTAGQMGPMCRKDSSATQTCYVSFCDNTLLYLFKIVSGSYTSLGSTAQSLSVPDTIKLIVDGSAQDDYFNGSAVNSATDSAISGNLRCGCYGMPFASDASPHVRGDNFEAGDNAAAGNRRRRLLCGA